MDRSNRVLSTPACRLDDARMVEVHEAGGKGAGLLRIPPAWYPPTLVIPPLVAMSERPDATEIAEVVRQALSDDTLEATVRAFHHSRVIVRSSAETEDLRERGKFTSVICDATPADIRAALTTVYLSSMDAGESPGAMAILLQPTINALISGHLSNEHRISRTAWIWTLEEQVGGSVSDRQIGATTAQPAGDEPLLCPSLLALEARLREVSRRLSTQPYRHHLEWIWDGNRLWIVQADRVIPLTGPPPGELWSPRTGHQIKAGDLRHWRFAPLSPVTDAEQSRWPKIRNVQEFARAGLPVPQLFLLDDPEVIASFAAGEVPPSVVDDLRLLSSGDVIVRTDVDTHAGGPKLFLPKTDNVADAEVLGEFLVKTTKRLVESHIGAGEIAFIAHRYLRARACAWTYARPGDPLIQIDSTWGLVDGLNWCSHDSSLVNVTTGYLRRQVVPKPTFMDVGRDRGWASRETPTEWLWRSSINEGQLRTVAEGAYALAGIRDRPVATMWFINILDGADADCLPWFSTPYEIEPGITTSHSHQGVPRYKILTRDDLQLVARQRPPKGTILRLQPGGDLIRNESFVKDVAELALSGGYVIEIEGSPLAHPYYILKRRGVPVVCVGRDWTESGVVHHNKLVRDNIPDLIEQRGEQAVAYRAGDSERQELLRAKVVEEALELLRSTALDDSLGELADLVEVMRALQSTLGISDADLSAAVDRKRTRRGGFDESLVLLRTSLSAAAPSSEETTGTLPGMDELTAAQEPWQVREQGRQLVVSYVPPPPGKPQTIRSKLDGTDVSVSYRKDAIVVESIARTNERKGARQDPIPGLE
ncbi:nucleoside triphosphate pyrophosphohydrolase [Actinoplanes sp. NPDC048791]|uniref:nucleoside triphosphate pyrophosphohydrolase n=1 Tax=Actinoplanes sp. NPDC048791 TaxID=3154623 RepID=UPI0033F5B5FD